MNEQFMLEAIRLAEVAASIGEVPVGAIIVLNNEIIGRGYNSKEKDKTPINHAEINAINDACKKIGDWRLNGAVMYSTCEPCVMCAGAIVHSRISKVYFGVREPKFGGVVSCANIFSNSENKKSNADDNSSIKEFNNLNHNVLWEEGLLYEEISLLMKDFFKKIRSK